MKTDLLHNAWAIMKRNGIWILPAVLGLTVIINHYFHAADLSAYSNPSPNIYPAAGKEWYVSAEGKPHNKGTSNSPWDLATALSGGPSRTEVKPGDTIWLYGGSYVGAFVSWLQGNPNAPIVIRQYPGHRAIVDRREVNSAKQPALKVKGSWVWFRDFEITNSSPERGRNSPTTGVDEPWRGSGADVYAPNVKFINMIFHDNGHGIWDKEDMTEVYGCLFFYNGNNKREHALYIGNNKGTKYIIDNVVFAQAGYGILGFSKSRPQKGIHLEGNATFNNGSLTLDDQTTGNIQVGGLRGVSAEGIVLKNNYVYNSPGTAKNKDYGIRLGYEDTNNNDVRIIDNYIVSKMPLRIWWWQEVEARGNTIYSNGRSIELRVSEGVNASVYKWDSNTYVTGKNGGPEILANSSVYNFADWKQLFGLDRNSRVERSPSLRPNGVRTFIRPNKYEPGRAHIIVYNWDLREQVLIDVSSFLPLGSTYEVLDVQNYFGEPIACGNYNGNPIPLPMKMTNVTRPVGNVERPPIHTAPEFAVFVLKQTANPHCR